MDQTHALDLQIGLDTAQAQTNARDLEARIRAIEDSSTSASRVLDGFGKIAGSAFGILTGALMAPVNLSNFMGQLNQKITQVDGSLEKYRKTLLEFKSEDFFKPGEGAFGLAPHEYDKIMKQFATGTVAIEKYGAAARANLEGYTQGAGMGMKLLGFDPTQSTNALTDMHKTIGLTFNEMEPFVKTMGNISKSANLNSDQFFKLTKQVTGLAKAYGLSGEEGKKFVTGSLAVGAALSQLGFDASEMIAKMNEVATGSEQGLITSLLLGFKPGDTTGQLEAFQKQAKDIVAMAQSAGPQIAPYIMQQLGSAYGMNMSPEQMMRLAQGLPMDEKGKKQDAADILQQILDDQKDPQRAAEKPYVTAANTGNALLSAIHSLLAGKFFDALTELQTWAHTTLHTIMTKISHGIDEIIKWSGKLDNLFGLHTSKLGELVTAALAIPVALKFGGGLVEGIGKAVVMSIFGGGSATAVGGAAAGITGILGVSGGGLIAAVGALIPIVLTGLIAYGIGTWVQKNILSKETNEGIGDFVTPKTRLLGTQDSTSSLDLVERNKDSKNFGKSEKEILAQPSDNEDYFAGGAPSEKDWSGGESSGRLDRSAVMQGARAGTGTKKTTLSRDDIKRMTRETATKMGFTADQAAAFYAIIGKESGGFNPTPNVGKAGEIGVGQLMPANIKQYHVDDPNDPGQNLIAAAQIFKASLERNPNDLKKAIMGYNLSDKNLQAGHFGTAKKYAEDVMKSAGLTKVHDEGANSHLASIDNGINRIVNALAGSSPAIAGALPDPAVSEALGRWGF